MNTVIKQIKRCFTIYSALFITPIFGTIRQAAGSNDHPATPTFLQLYKLLSTYSILKPPVSGNCTVHDQKEPKFLLTVKDLKDIYKPEKKKQVLEIQKKLNSLIEQSDWEADDILDHDYSRAPVLDCVVYFVTVITTRIRGHQHCGHEQLVQCSKPLSIITDSGLTFVSSKSDLDRICPDLKEALKCIHGYTRKCMSLQHRRHFKQLFHGTSTMVHELCNNSTYQEEYLKYAPCMKEVAAENEVCFSRYSKAMNEVHNKAPIQNESNPDVVSYQKRKRQVADEGIKNVCCSFQEYVECSTHTMRRACGEEAAQFSRSFLDRMSSSMIKMHCSEYGAEQCGLSSSASKLSYITATLTSLSLLLLRYAILS